MSRTHPISQPSVPRWQRKMPVKYRYLPGRVSKGVSVQGMKSQTGPVTITIIITRAMPLEIRKAMELGILSSLARFELYQTFSTDQRWVKNFTGDNIMRTPPIRN